MRGIIGCVHNRRCVTEFSRVTDLAQPRVKGGPGEIFCQPFSKYVFSLISSPDSCILFN